MNRDIRIGVIGSGRMNQRAHIPNFLAEGCRIPVLHDPRPQTARMVAEHFHIPDVCDDAAQLIERDDLDVICISVPDHVHSAYAIPALEAGKHVFMEKPVSTNSRDGLAVVQKARETGRVLQIGFQRRHDPAAEIVKRILDEWRESGEMGQMKWMEFVCAGGDWNCTPDPLIAAGDTPAGNMEGALYPDWLPEDLVGQFSSFNNGRSHGLDLLRYFFGPPTAIVAAHPKRSRFAHLEWAGADVFFIEGTFEGGYWNEYLEIHFDHGWLRFRTPPALFINMPGTVEIFYGREGRHETIRPPAGWAFRREVQHFLDVIENGVPQSPTPEDAWQTVNLTEQIFRHALNMPEPEPVNERPA